MRRKAGQRTQQLVALFLPWCASHADEEVDDLVASDTKEHALPAIAESSVVREPVFDVTLHRVRVAVELEGGVVLDLEGVLDGSRAVRRRRAPVGLLLA